MAGRVRSLAGDGVPSRVRVGWIMKKILLVLLVVYLASWMYYETRCNVIAGSHAEIRFDGVYCWLDLGGFYTSGKLSQLEEKHGKPPLNLWNDPRFYPAMPTIESVDL